ncbi:hypothetical protein Y032_0482g2271 [Ancylostoma ceylanicum]|uniref:Uncharacterized protein n=1 Tax=Ancylostoma ceylanicum TaxID=53326 RepID=A0A016WV79_9BILA|nr:hypothetical protein Y032_0482g2271 [Ancylostoma ceylanicum]
MRWASVFKGFVGFMVLESCRRLRNTSDSNMFTLEAFWICGHNTNLDHAGYLSVLKGRDPPHICEDFEAVLIR